jgi:hypothetical protein
LKKDEEIARKLQEKFDRENQLPSNRNRLNGQSTFPDQLFSTSRSASSLATASTSAAAGFATANAPRSSRAPSTSASRILPTQGATATTTNTNQYGLPTNIDERLSILQSLITREPRSGLQSPVLNRPSSRGRARAVRTVRATTSAVLNSNDLGNVILKN